MRFEIADVFSRLDLRKQGSDQNEETETQEKTI